MRLLRALFRPAGLAWLGVVLAGSLLSLAALARRSRTDRALARPSAEAVAASRQSAREAARSARWQDAAGACDAVLAAEPDDREALLLRAEALYHLGSRADREADLRRAADDAT